MVLLVVDLFQPVGGFAVELLHNGDVGHGCGGRGAMPMLLPRRKPDHVAGSNFFDRASPVLGPAAAVGHNQGLAERVGVPGGPSAWLERDANAKRPRWIVCLSGSMRTVPVKYSAGPLPEGRDPLLLISMLDSCFGVKGATDWARRIAGMASAAPVVFRKLRREKAMIREW
jgi:hypothetical protein